jgi:hypothetical protein
MGLTSWNDHGSITSNTNIIGTIMEVLFLIQTLLERSWKYYF